MKGGGLGLDIFNLVSIGIVFYGMLVVLLLLVSKSTYHLANRMLALIIGIGIWYVITTLLILTGQFVRFSFLFRIGLPFYYATPPLIYLYVQSRTDKTFRFKYIYLFHFLPVLAAAIDLLPFYFSSPEAKQAVVESLAQDSNRLLDIRTGIIPDIWHVMLRPIHGVVYCAITGVYLYRVFRDKKLKKSIENFNGLKRWLILFTVFFCIIYVGLFVMNVFWVGLPAGPDKLLNFTMFSFFVCLAPFLGIHIYLFFNTQLIFGKSTRPRPAAAEFEKGDAGGREDAHIREIEKLIVEKALFKNPGITAPEIAGMLGMAPHTFSATLNAHYGKRFTEFINGYRINYVISELKRGANENMSIEGIATEAGFASRSAFYNSFKKETGLTPSEYLKKNG